MGYSKRQFVSSSFEEIGLANYVFDLQPEQIESALRKLDAMMAAWNAKGIRLGYPIPGSPEDSSLDEPTNVPDSSNEAIIKNLAIRIAPSMGRAVSLDTKIAAKEAYNALLSRVVHPGERQFPSTLPRGAGHKTWNNYDNPFVTPPVDPLLAGPDGSIEFN